MLANSTDTNFLHHFQIRPQTTKIKDLAKEVKIISNCLKGYTFARKSRTDHYYMLVLMILFRFMSMIANPKGIQNSGPGKSHK